MDNYSLSDLAAVTNGDGFGKDGNAWWIIILFLFMFGNNGFGRSGDCASTEDVQNQFNFSALERQNNETVAAVRQASYDVTGASKDIAYNQLGQIRDIESMVAQNGYSLSNCCCELNRNVDSVKFDMANYVSAIQMNNCENTQKILDAMTTNRMADMQNQINQLQLQAALCGVVRYPTALTYNAGGSPFCNTGCNTSCC